MKDNPLISIITVNYNQSVVTSELLDSLMELNYPNFEIIVVDNGSSESATWLKSSYPKIELIESENNLGFAGGNNLGIRESKGKYLFLVNNDCELPSDAVDPLVRLMESDNRIAMASPKIKFYWDSSLIQFAGFTKMSKIGVRNRAIGYLEKDSEQFSQTKESHSIHGAALMVRRESLKRIGLMPEIYFLYYEEHDWAQMALRAGYQLYYCADSYLLHKESLSTGKNSPLKSYYLNRARLIYTIRNYRAIGLFLALLFQISISLPKNSLVMLFKGEFQNLKSYLMGQLWVVRNYNLIKASRDLIKFI